MVALNGNHNYSNDNQGTPDTFLILQALFSNATDAFLLADDEARYVDANPAACDLLGFEREEILQMKVWDITPEPNLNAGWAAWKDFVANGRQSGEYTVRCKDGKLREMEYRAVANILPGLHLSILRDVTARKQAESALQRERELVQKVFERIPIMIVRYPPELGRFQVNKEFERVTGWSVEEASQLNLMEVCYPDPEYREKVRAFMVSLREGWMDFDMTAKDGSLVATSWSNICLSDDTHAGIGIDIRERKRAEQEVRSSNERLQTVLSSITDAYIALDHDWRFIEINPVAEELVFHRNAHNLAGKVIWREYPEEIESSLHKQCRAALQSQQPVHFEAKFRSVNRWFMVHAYPYADRLEIYMRDITARKEAEEALLEVNAELEQRVRARTREFEQMNRTLQAEIVKRKQMEAELSELQRHLIDRIEAEQLTLARELHDGPMQELYGLGYRIANLENNNPILAQELHAIQKEVMRVNENLRAVSRELRPPSLTAFGLQVAMREYADRYVPIQEDLGLRFDFRADDKDINEQLSLALFRIYQVTLTNVVRHARANQVVIRLTANADQVVLEIEDDGIGFELPESWIWLAREGHLGLVGAKERAESVGGKMIVKSKQGKGTIVRVIVPRRDNKLRYN